MSLIRLTLGSKSIDIEEIYGWLIKPLYIAMLYFSVFSRQSGLFGLSGGMLSVLLATLLFGMAVFHLLFISEDKNISALTFTTVLFFIFLGVTPLFSYLVYEQLPSLVFRYSAETASAFFLFFSVYYFMKTKFIKPKFFLYLIAVLGTITAISSLITLLNADQIRRLTGLSGLNYMGSTFAMCAVIWIMIIRRKFGDGSDLLKKLAMIFCFLFVFLVLMLSGTRAGAIAFFWGLFFLQVLGFQSKKFTKYSFIGIIIISAVVAIVALNIDLSRLFNRYKFDDISYMAEVRFSIYARSVTDLTLPEFILGRPDLYSFEFEDNRLVPSRELNTHNYFLGLIRYNGILAFLLFVLILIIILSRYIVFYRKHKNNVDLRVTGSTLFVFLSMALIYTMFSGGKVTRMFILYISLGYVLAYFELLARARNREDFKQLIL